MMQEPVSLHQMFRNTVSTIKKKSDIFLLEKKSGSTYTPTTYGEFLDKLNAISAYLVEESFTKGDRCALILENCPEYLLFDQALLQIGAVNASIYPTLPENEIAYILKDSGSKGVLVGNAFLLKKVLKAAEGAPHLTHIFLTYNPAEPITHATCKILSVSHMIEEGMRLYSKNQSRIEELFNQLNADDLASLIYTSGTTGVPKGVMLTHGNFMSNVLMAKDMVPSISSSDRYLSFLPLCHVYERLATYYLGVYIGAEIAFAQGIESLSANMIEVKPTIMTTVPRLLERVKGKVIKNAEAKGGLSEKIFNWALMVGEKVRLQKEARKPVGPVLSMQYKLADKLVFRKVKAKLGGNMRLLVSGGAALPQHVGEFFGNLGINALEGYGLTETSPLISINVENEQVYGTVGRVVKDLEVAIADTVSGEIKVRQTKSNYNPSFECEEGEILVKGPSVMQGYWNKAEETAKVLDPEGWFHTGDIGRFEKGNLKITDRLKNMLVNAYGKNIYPTPVENIYLKSTKLEQVFLIGDGREAVTAILVPNREELKERFGVNEAFFEEADPFIRNEEMVQWMNEDIKTLSNELAKYERIKRFLLKRVPFSVEEGELTPTLKAKRKVIETRYAADIEKMYLGLSAD